VARFPVGDREVVAAGQCVGMVGTQHLFPDTKGALEQR
jgi:hypothetical protein